MMQNLTNEEWHSLIKSIESKLIEPKDAPLASMSAAEAAAFIDHTLLKPDAEPEQIDKLCDEAKKYNFKTVCVRLNYVARAVKKLSGTSVGIACVIDFPEGTADWEAKEKELAAAIEAGTTEADAVLNRSYLHRARTTSSSGLLEKLPDYVSTFSDLSKLRYVASRPTTLKLILETSQLSTDEIIAASVLAHYAGFDFIKTSTGFCERGATVEDVRLMKSVAIAAAKETADEPMQIKASGGIRSFNDMQKMAAAGATRIGASAGVTIVEEASGVRDGETHDAGQNGGY
ncbi:deoxyribose-phosphate aldolase [Rhizodiscina lignyota]|uniref:deoxyribose-phosphate aldolase n=1 Tax=Rhizodiscina lignyota TaxID=1504668 RepID=A0A9P4IRF9_9PEZI|nr:deoxyribose-phosphate aldolase [Rhizodiscina lignyota]